MALGYTLHSILRSKKELPIGTVVEFTSKDYGDLLALGAIRAPTEAELQLHGMSGAAADRAEVKSSKKSGRKSAQDDAASNSTQNDGDEKSDGSGEADKDPEVEAGDLDI